MKRRLILAALWLGLLCLDVLMALFGDQTWRQARAVTRRHWQDLTRGTPAAP